MPKCIRVYVWTDEFEKLMYRPVSQTILFDNPDAIRRLKIVYNGPRPALTILLPQFMPRITSFSMQGHIVARDINHILEECTVRVKATIAVDDWFRWRITALLAKLKINAPFCDLLSMHVGHRATLINAKYAAINDDSKFHSIEPVLVKHIPRRGLWIRRRYYDSPANYEEREGHSLWQYLGTRDPHAPMIKAARRIF